MTATTTARDVVADCRDMADVLAAARRFGLAMPFDLTLTAYRIRLQFADPADWRAWAAYLSGDGDPIEVESVPYGDRDHLWLRGQAEDVPLELIAIVPAREGQAHVDAVTA